MIEIFFFAVAVALALTVSAMTLFYFFVATYYLLYVIVSKERKNEKR